MRRKHQIIELHRGRQPIVPRRVLGADGGGVQEEGVGGEVSKEAEDVDGWEVDCGAAGGAPGEVEKGLRVEGERPGEGVYPAERVR